VRLEQCLSALAHTLKCEDLMRTAGTHRSKSFKHYVSTGHLPPGPAVQAAVAEAHARFEGDQEGKNASHYPALARVQSDLFGLCLASVTGWLVATGDADYTFTIMSIAKPFTLALVLQAVGHEEVRDKVGLNSTGLAFNSIMAIELHPRRLTNPMVNSGALAIVSLVPGDTAESKWQFIQHGLSRFAGRTLQLDEEMYASASTSNDRNRAIARVLYDYQCLYFDPVETTDIYTRQSCLNVTTKDLAVMAATLANGGVNPITCEPVIAPEHCQQTLAVMATAGLYETSGDWLFDIGLPGKSGVSGGLITTAPGKGGLGAFAPRLDPAGNSVKGVLAARFLSARLGLNLLQSTPTRSPAVAPATASLSSV
jgi:glutaminase